MGKETLRLVLRPNPCVTVFKTSDPGVGPLAIQVTIL